MVTNKARSIILHRVSSLPPLKYSDVVHVKLALQRATLPIFRIGGYAFVAVKYEVPKTNPEQIIRQFKRELQSPKSKLNI